MFTRVKKPHEIEAMRESGKMLAGVLNHLKTYMKVGITEREVAIEAARELKKLGGSPAFKGYQGFPDVICISRNDAVVHGVPNDAVIQDGDIVSLDFGVNYKGMITDSAVTVPVGHVVPEVMQLVSVTKASLDAGIATLHDGVQVGDIGAAIESVLNLHKYGIVRDLVGHGVGHAVHEDPNIPNYGKVGTGPTLHAGMTIAIEPMANLGSELVQTDDDGWKIRTRDGKPSAHFEHTVLITQEGFEILTQI
jgi:methionyl aminopeptidase